MLTLERLGKVFCEIVINNYNRRERMPPKKAAAQILFKIDTEEKLRDICSGESRKLSGKSEQATEEMLRLVLCAFSD